MISIFVFLQHRCTTYKMARYIRESLTRNFLIIPVLFIIMVSCNPIRKQNGKPVITVSIMPQKFFIEKIAGDKFLINVMVPPGVSHENYDPTPGQIAALSNTVVYIRIGNIEFENVWINKFSDIYPGLNIVDLSSHLQLIRNPDDHGNHAQNEPHTWMSPGNVVIMAKDIYESLAAIDRENEDYYKLKCEHFITEIDSINEIITSKFKNIKSSGFIIYHPALTYYAKDYGLNQYPLEIEGKSPSAFVIRQLIEISRKENIRTIVVQKQFDQSKAQIIADETGGKIISIDPLDYNWSNQILEITDKLSSSLQD